MQEKFMNFSKCFFLSTTPVNKVSHKIFKLLSTWMKESIERRSFKGENKIIWYIQQTKDGIINKYILTKHPIIHIILIFWYPTMHMQSIFTFLNIFANTIKKRVYYDIYESLLIFVSMLITSCST